MKNQLILMLLAVFLFACGGAENDVKPRPERKAKTEKKDSNAGKGIGEIKNVALNNPLDGGMVSKGKAIYEMKCAACHKTSAQRVVGPGFAKITEKRKPEWIMNMVTNVEVMLSEDPEAQKLLKECLVRMPNQNLSIGDARDVLEWMYANDGMAVSE